MQRNFNTDKINDENYILRHASFTIHNLFFIKVEKPLKSGVVSSSSSKNA
jgi:hypothetical protein